MPVHKVILLNTYLVVIRYCAILLVHSFSCIIKWKQSFQVLLLLQIPATQKALFQSLLDNVNEFCKCNFTVKSPDVICYDTARVTLRGIVRGMLLPYLKDWVKTTATTLNPYGIPLKVDNGCTVQIQSLDDPECPIGNMSAQEAMLSDATVVTTGIAFTGLALVAVVLIAVMVAIILLIRRKLSRKRPTM